MKRKSTPAVVASVPAVVVSAEVAATPVAPFDLDATLERFANAQDVAPLSRGTYLRSARIFFRWVESQGVALHTIDRSTVLRYREHLLASGMSSLTVSGYLVSVRRFFAWAEGVKLYANIARDIKGPKRKQQFRKQPLTEDKARELLSFTPEDSLRDRAIVALLVRTGLRTIEAVRANVEDIEYKGGRRVLLVHGKGRSEKDQFVILTDKAFQPIAEYLATRTDVKAGQPLFTSTSNNSKGGRLTTRTVRGIAKARLRAIDLDSKAFTAHSLRHTTAVTIMRRGGDIEHAQHVLRHSSPATTQIYTATIKEEQRLTRNTEGLIDDAY